MHSNVHEFLPLKKTSTLLFSGIPFFLIYFFQGVLAMPGKGVEPSGITNFGKIVTQVTMVGTSGEVEAQLKVNLLRTVKGTNFFG